MDTVANALWSSCVHFLAQWEILSEMAAEKVYNIRNYGEENELETVKRR